MNYQLEHNEQERELRRKDGSREEKAHRVARVERIHLDLGRLGLRNDKDVGVLSLDIAGEACEGES